MSALLSERGRAREFWVEARINFRKRWTIGFLQ
jgi:hypothetical protein